MVDIITGLNLFRSSAKHKFQYHIKHISKFDFIPNNWVWHQDKIKELKHLDISLLNDLGELYHNIKLDEKNHEDLKFVLEELHIELKKLPALNNYIKTQEKEALIINNFLNKIKSTIKEISKEYKFVQNVINSPIPFDNNVNRIYSDLTNYFLEAKKDGIFIDKFLNIIELDGFIKKGSINKFDLSSLRIITSNPSNFI